MNIYVVKGIKNIGFFCLKLAIAIFWISTVVTNVCGYAVDVIEGFDNYSYVRGFENYGEKTVANLKGNVYIYTVNDVEYKIKKSELPAESIDKSIDIYYDILEPEQNILVEELKNADNFYSDIFRGVTNGYITIVISVIGLGISFFILDKIKYNKLIWKQFA